MIQRNREQETGMAGHQMENLVTFFPYVVLVLLLCFFSCAKKDKPFPDIPFDKLKWDKVYDGKYSFRKQMINDLLNNYQWKGVSKDSLIAMLGQPDSREEGNFIYNYERRPFLGGLGTTIEALVFEFNEDSTIRKARLNDGGWD